MTKIKRIALAIGCNTLSTLFWLWINALGQHGLSVFTGDSVRDMFLWSLSGIAFWAGAAIPLVVTMVCVIYVVILIADIICTGAE